MRPKKVSFFRQIPLYIAVLLLGAVLIGWIFSLASDAPQEKKITIFIDAPSVHSEELSLYLEEELPRGIRMIRVHPFSYAMFDMDELNNADVYIVPASKVPDYIDSFREIGENEKASAFYTGKEGVKVFDAASGAKACEWIDFKNAEGNSEDFLLFFGAGSIHTGSENSVDDAALSAAERLIQRLKQEEL